MKAIRLTPAQARAHLLRQQGLVKPLSTPLAAVSQLIAVQTQYARSLSVAIASRANKAKVDWEYPAMQKGQILKSWTLRNTLHAHGYEEWALLLKALSDRRQDRMNTWFEREMGLNSSQVEQMVNDTVEALATHGPLTRPQLHEKVPILAKVPYAGWGCDVMAPSHQGRLVLITPEKGASQFKAVEPPAFELGAEEARIRLLRRYLKLYGPTTLADFTYWTGLPMALTRAAWKSLEEHLVPIEIKEHSAKLWMHEEDLPSRWSPAVPDILFLAKFDVLTLGHKNKDLFLGGNLHKTVYRPAGQIEAIVLAKGEVAATWRLEIKSGNRAIVRTFGCGATPLDPVATEQAISKLGSKLGLALEWEQT